jgi:type VI secretion system protein ImpL
MKKLLFFLLSLFLLLLTLLCVVLAFTPGLRLKIPFLIAATALFLFFLFITLFRKLLIRKRVNSFIERVISRKKSSDSGNIQSTGKKDEQVEQVWTDAIKKIRNSTLRSYGNPLYVLPWYLVIGESGTGKTSLLKHSGLTSKLSSMNSSEGLPGTKNCDWWFFNEAIVLDTAGRYTIPLEIDRDTQEWEEFLKNLAAFRKKEPVNGIVAAIAADTLTKCSAQELRDRGVQIRSRIDQVMRILGSAIPVYIMITKMDLIFGMPEFFRALPRSKLGQAMGWCNDGNEVFSAELCNMAMNHIGDNLKQLQFVMLHNKQRPEAEVLVFPQRFLELSEKLSTFCSSLFSYSMYNVTPVFRGLYFSSSLQKIEQGVPDETELDNVHSGGLFLKDFFSRILPSDRHFHWHIPQYRRKVNLLLKIIIGSWILLWGSLSLLIYFSFNNIHNTFKNVKEQCVLSGLSPSRKIELLRSNAHYVEKRNESLFFGRAGFSQGKRIELGLKSFYAKEYEQKYISEVMQSTARYIDGVNSNMQIDSVTGVISFLSSMENAGKSSDALGKIAENIQGSSVRLPCYSAVKSLHADFLYDWLKWRDTLAANSLNRSVYAMLSKVINDKGSDLRWCTDYVIHNVDDVSMKQFWADASRSGGSEKNEIDSTGLRLAVGGAFTLEGFSRIHMFLNHIDSAFADSIQKKIYQEYTKQFYPWYWEQYFSQWYALTADFIPAIDASMNPGNYTRFFRQLSSGEDPFIRFIRQSATQYDTVETSGRIPGWSSQVVLLRDMDRYTVKKEIRDSTRSFVRKMINSINGFTGKITNSVKDINDEYDNIRRNKIEQAFPQWTAYKQELSSLGAFLNKPDGPRLFARGLFDKKDSTARYYTNLLDASSMLKQRLFGAAADDVVWSLLDGPFEIVQNIAYKEACRQIETIWGSDVLSKISQREDDSHADLLFAPDSGLVRKFCTDTRIVPFVNIGSDGYLKLVNGIGGPLPISDEFINFVNKGFQYELQDVYTITLQTVPFSTNNDIAEEPYQTILRLECSDGDGVLENFNSNENFDFTYKPSSCGNVSLKVIFPSFIAVKTWRGKWAFPNFLRDFRNGTVTFTPDDFDIQSRKKLKKINCSRMQISYTFDSNEAASVIRILDYLSNRVPSRVTVPE